MHFVVQYWDQTWSWHTVGECWLPLWPSSASVSVTLVLLFLRDQALTSPSLTFFSFSLFCLRSHCVFLASLGLTEIHLSWSSMHSQFLCFLGVVVGALGSGCYHVAVNMKSSCLCLLSGGITSIATTFGLISRFIGALLDFSHAQLMTHWCMKSWFPYKLCSACHRAVH